MTDPNTPCRLCGQPEAKHPGGVYCPAPTIIIGGVDMSRQRDMTAMMDAVVKDGTVVTVGELQYVPTPLSCEPREGSLIKLRVRKSGKLPKGTKPQLKAWTLRKE